MKIEENWKINDYLQTPKWKNSETQISFGEIGVIFINKVSNKFSSKNPGGREKYQVRSFSREFDITHMEKVNCLLKYLKILRKKIYYFSGIGFERIIFDISLTTKRVALPKVFSTFNSIEIFFASS